MKFLEVSIFRFSLQMAVCQNLVPLVNIKIAGKWMFIPLRMVLIGIDPYQNDSMIGKCSHVHHVHHGYSQKLGWFPMRFPRSKIPAATSHEPSRSVRVSHRQRTWGQRSRGAAREDLSGDRPGDHVDLGRLEIWRRWDDLPSGKLTYNVRPPRYVYIAIYGTRSWCISIQLWGPQDMFVGLCSPQ